MLKETNQTKGYKDEFGDGDIYFEYPYDQTVEEREVPAILSGYDLTYFDADGRQHNVEIV